MILTLCPSKGRPDLCYQMLESYRLTAVCPNSITLLLSSDDKLSDYDRCLKLVDNYHIHAASTTITEMVNDALRLHDKSIKFYHLTNDDVIYRTKAWDETLSSLLSEPGIAYGDDLFQSANLCTFPFISAELVSAVGWLHMPTLNRYAADLVWHNIGRELRLLRYSPDVIIEHLHPLNGKRKGEIDKTLNNYDSMKFIQWLAVSNKDKDKIREVICQYR